MLLKIPNSEAGLRAFAALAEDPRSEPQSLRVKSHGVSALYFTWQPYPAPQGTPVLSTPQHKTQSAEEYESLNTLV